MQRIYKFGLNSREHSAALGQLSIIIIVSEASESERRKEGKWLNRFEWLFAIAMHSVSIFLHCVRQLFHEPNKKNSRRLFSFTVDISSNQW